MLFCMALFRWIKQEILHVIPVFLYFFIFFTLINWIETFLFEANGMSPFRFYEVVIAAALIAKIVLVVDHLPWINWFKNRPLIFYYCMEDIDLLGSSFSCSPVDPIHPLFIWWNF